MNRHALLTTALLAAAVAAHAQPVAIERHASEFEPAILFAAPAIPAPAAMLLPSDEAMVSLRALKDKATGAVRWLLVLRTRYQAPTWRHYESASLAGGTRLPAQRIRALVLACSSNCEFTETVSVDLPPQVMGRARSEGLHTRWNARTHGDFELTVPADHVLALEAAAR